MAILLPSADHRVRGPCLAGPHHNGGSLAQRSFHTWKHHCLGRASLDLLVSHMADGKGRVFSPSLPRQAEYTPLGNRQRNPPSHSARFVALSRYDTARSALAISATGGFAAFLAAHRFLPV